MIGPIGPIKKEVLFLILAEAKRVITVEAEALMALAESTAVQRGCSPTNPARASASRSTYWLPSRPPTHGSSSD